MSILCIVGVLLASAFLGAPHVTSWSGVEVELRTLTENNGIDAVRTTSLVKSLIGTKSQAMCQEMVSQQEEFHVVVAGLYCLHSLDEKTFLEYAVKALGEAMNKSLMWDVIQPMLATYPHNHDFANDLIRLADRSTITSNYFWIMIGDLVSPDALYAWFNTATRARISSSHEAIILAIILDADPHIIFTNAMKEALSYYRLIPGLPRVVNAVYSDVREEEQFKELAEDILSDMSLQHTDVLWFIMRKREYFMRVDLNKLDMPIERRMEVARIVEKLSASRKAQ